MLQVVRKAQHVGAIAVRGNHDDAGLAAWEGWQQGGKLKEKHKWVKELHHRDAHWLYHLPWSISLPSHRAVIVHAGLVPQVGPLLMEAHARVGVSCWRPAGASAPSHGSSATALHR